MHPKGQFCGGTAKCGLWRECSVGGDVFSLRESRSAQQKGQPVCSFIRNDFVLECPSRVFTFFMVSDLWRIKYLTRWYFNRFMWRHSAMAFFGRTSTFTGNYHRLYALCYILSNALFRFWFWFCFLQTKRDLEKLIDEVNAGRPQCPVGLNTLVIPRKVNIGDQINQPYVYLNCGHVQGNIYNIMVMTHHTISWILCN